MEPVKNAIESLSVDGLLVTKLVAELNSEGGGLFVKLEGRGRHRDVLAMKTSVCTMTRVSSTTRTKIKAMK